MENNQDQYPNRIQWPSTPGDVSAEFNVANGDPDNQLTIGELMALDQIQSPDRVLSLDVRPKFVRYDGDEYAEQIVDWGEQNDKLKIEARMRVKDLLGLEPGESGELEAYQQQLEFLQRNFGTPKPIRAVKPQ